jgi:hypothetical protein
MIVPIRTTVNGVSVEWDGATWLLWESDVAIRFKDGEKCSTANYWRRDDGTSGFVYTVGREVCYVNYARKR